MTILILRDDKRQRFIDCILIELNITNEMLTIDDDRIELTIMIECSSAARPTACPSAAFDVNLS